ncbi:hypothetical protein BRC73_02540, partial [Halobacteriales archaeon QH_7_66_37]
GGTELSNIAGSNLSIDSNGTLNASGGGGGGGGGISSLSGGEGIDPASIGDGDTLSVAWGDANDLDSDGNVTGGGGGGGGNWTANGNLLEPSDGSIDGIDVDEVRAPLLAATSGPLEITVDGARALELTAESGGEAGNVVAGHSSNSVVGGNVGATIGGGGFDDGTTDDSHTLDGNYSVIGGGRKNETTGFLATIAGGSDNVAGIVDAIGGGTDNEATGTWTAIPGGVGNIASGRGSFVAGGFNEAIGEYATVTGGAGSSSDANGVARRTRRAPSTPPSPAVRTMRRAPSTPLSSAGRTTKPAATSASRSVATRRPAIPAHSSLAIVRRTESRRSTGTRHVSRALCDRQT